MAKGAATSSAALMAKEWCLWLGERSGLTGRLVFRRSRTEQDGALAFAANARLRRVVSLIALIAFVFLPKRPLYHIPGNRQARESAAPCGRARRRRTHPAGHRAAAAAQPRVEQVARRVADHVQAVHHQGTIGNCFPPSRCGSVSVRDAQCAQPRQNVRRFLHLAERLQLGFNHRPIEPGAHAQHYAFDIRPVPRAIRKCFESSQILRRAGIQKGLGQELVEGRSFDYPLLERSAPREMSIGMPRADWSRSTRVR